MKDIDTVEFYQLLGSGQTFIVDFWAPWCAPCRAIAPILEQAQAETGANIVKINSDENQELLNQYGIRGIPCIIAFRNGQEVARKVGGGSKQHFLDFVRGL